MDRNKIEGHFSTNMRLSTSKDGDLLTFFDWTNETQKGIKESSLSKKLIDNPERVANREKFKNHLPPNHVFRF